VDPNNSLLLLIRVLLRRLEMYYFIAFLGELMDMENNYLFIVKGVELKPI
jgi:hypothetical protein